MTARPTSGQPALADLDLRRHRHGHRSVDRSPRDRWRHPRSQDRDRRRTRDARRPPRVHQPRRLLPSSRIGCDTQYTGHSRGSFRSPPRGRNLSSLGCEPQGSEAMGLLRKRGSLDRPRGPDFSSTRNGGRPGGGLCGVRGTAPCLGRPPPGLPLKGEEKGRFLTTLCSPAELPKLKKNGGRPANPSWG